MHDRIIKIGTRGSKLALWQARKTRECLLRFFPHLAVEIVIIKTTGDIISDVSLSKIGGKALFTKEIEDALTSGTVDMAVHSLKDLPTVLPDGLSIGAVLKRGEVRDVLISKSGIKLAAMNEKDRIATSSLRRKAQLLSINPRLHIVDIRGNVDTRLRKMEEGHCEALVMAGAGILRLGYEELITEYLDPQVFLPAVSQGAIAIEVRNDDTLGEMLGVLNDEYTWTVTMAERAFLQTIEGGCQIPAACYIREWEGMLEITGLLADTTGREVIRKTMVSGHKEASAKATELALSIINNGGKKILEKIRQGM